MEKGHVNREVNRKFARKGGGKFGKKWHVCKVVNLENGSCKRKGKRVSAGEFARKLG